MFGTLARSAAPCDSAGLQIDTARSAASDISASARGGFIFGRDMRMIWIHMMKSRNSGTATCMNTIREKKRLVSVPVAMKLRAIGSPKIGSQSRSSEETTATNWASLSHTSQ